MAKSFDTTDRYLSPAPGRLPEQRSKATGGGKSPLDPMGANVPGWCAEPAQNPGDCPKGDCPKGDCDRTPLGKDVTGKKLPGM